MQQFAAFLILVRLFIVLVGTQFETSDGDKLAAVARLAGSKIPRGNATGSQFRSARSMRCAGVADPA